MLLKMKAFIWPLPTVRTSTRFFCALLGIFFHKVFLRSFQQPDLCFQIERARHSLNLKEICSNVLVGCSVNPHCLEAMITCPVPASWMTERAINVYQVLWQVWTPTQYFLYVFFSLPEFNPGRLYFSPFQNSRPQKNL